MGTDDKEAVVFDAVFVKRESGFAELSAAEFLALPLPDRVRSLLEHKVEFRRKGETVPAMDVLRSLMAGAAG